ncbi:MAG: 2-furoate---CoA ligase, partial [Gaiellales bacterium]|nr:2-furoate---CoA ligase [Gaiellales bacterium]
MNLGEHLLACAERTPEAVALVDGERSLTYAELLVATRSAAGGLAARGVGRGDHVAVALKNRLETAVLYWASQWLGAVFVPLNWRLRPDELTYCVTDSGARVLAVEEASAEAASAVPQTPLIAVAGAPAGDPLEPADGPQDPSGADEREPALMLYTSGTTGRPKGVPRSHRAERAAALAQLVQLELRPGDRTLGVMPLYHTMGMRSLLAASACGGLFCVQPEFRAEAALDAVERERLTSLYLAPTLFHDLVAAQRERPRDVSSVRALAYAGAPMAGVLVERCVEAFAPQAFVNHYGSTEIYTFTIHGD